MSTPPDQTNSSAEASPSGDGVPRSPSSTAEQEVSVLDLLLVLARNKRLIARTIFVFVLLGGTYALLAPEEYVSSAKVARESQETGGQLSLPGGISAGALAGLGLDLGGASSSGLTPSAFPEVLKSREVRLAVVRDTFQFPEADRPMTFVAHVNRPAGTIGKVLNYTLWLPWTLKNALGTAISESPTPAGTTDTTASTMLSKEEETALEVISGMVSTSVSEESGLMSISVTAGDPRLAADVAESFVNHLTSRVRALRTAKVRKRLRFVEERFREVEQELEATEERLARFLERNQNPTTASLRFRRDRLERQVRFKEQLYSDLQGQLTQTRLDLQRRQPVVTVVEQAVPPTKRTAPQRVLIVFLSLALGTVLGVGGALVNVFVGRDRRDDEREKVDEIKRRLIPKRWTVTE